MLNTESTAKMANPNRQSHRRQRQCPSPRIKEIVLLHMFTILLLVSPQLTGTNTTLSNSSSSAALVIRLGFNASTASTSTPITGHRNHNSNGSQTGTCILTSCQSEVHSLFAAQEGDGFEETEEEENVNEQELSVLEESPNQVKDQKKSKRTDKETTAQAQVHIRPRAIPLNKTTSPWDLRNQQQKKPRVMAMNETEPLLKTLIVSQTQSQSQEPQSLSQSPKRRRPSVVHNNSKSSPPTHWPTNSQVSHLLLPRILAHARSMAIVPPLNTQCLADIDLFTEALQSDRGVWARKVLDASGNYNPGFVLGNNHWLGSKALCQLVDVRQPPLRINYSNRFNRSTAASLLSATAPFSVHYAVVYAKHSSPMQFEMKFHSELLLHVGLCVPRSCSAPEVARLTHRHLQTAADAETRSAESAFRVQAEDEEEVHGKILELPSEFSQKIGLQLLKYLVYATVALTVLSFYFGKMIPSAAATPAGSAPKAVEVEKDRLRNATQQIPVFLPVESLFRRALVAVLPGKWETQVHRIAVQFVAPVVASGEGEETKKKGDSSEESVGNAVSTKKDSVSPIEVQWRRILNCFSLTDNFRAIWGSSSGGESSIPAIDGIRSICCALILCFHVCWFTFFQTSTPTLLFAYAERLSAALVANAAILVDVFFAISGFLHSYQFFRDEQKVQRLRTNSWTENSKFIGKSIWNRFIRLSVMHFMAILLSYVSTSYLNYTSEYHIEERNDLTCSRYWWRNVLLINNLFRHDELCANWTWSVACEMQFYALFTIGFVLYAKKPALMKKLFWCFTALIVLVSLGLTLRLRFRVTFDVMFATGTELYIAPWTRIHPYLTGVFIGWFVCTRSLETADMEKHQLSKYFCSLVIIAILGLATIHRGMSPLSCSLLLATIRYALGASVVWLIALSMREKKQRQIRAQQRAIAGVSTESEEATEPKGLCVEFLSCRFFQHISRLSYAIYLLHPIVITLLYGLRTGQGVRIELVTYIHETLGLFVIVYLVSLLATVCFERPLTRLIKLYF